MNSARSRQEIDVFLKQNDYFRQKTITSDEKKHYVGTASWFAFIFLEIQLEWSKHVNIMVPGNYYQYVKGILRSIFFRININKIKHNEQHKTEITNHKQN